MKTNGKKYTTFDNLNPSFEGRMNHNDQLIAVELDTGKVHILHVIIATSLYEGKKDLVHVEFTYDKDLRKKLRLFSGTFTADSGSCNCIVPDVNLMFISDAGKAIKDIKKLSKTLEDGAEMLKERAKMLKEINRYG